MSDDLMERAARALGPKSGRRWEDLDPIAELRAMEANRHRVKPVVEAVMKDVRQLRVTDKIYLYQHQHFRGDWWQVRVGAWALTLNRELVLTPSDKPLAFKSFEDAYSAAREYLAEQEGGE